MKKESFKRDNKSPLKCYCGRYKRLKFKDIECDLCYGKVKIKQDKHVANIVARFFEHYANQPTHLMSMLIRHHINVVEEIKWD